jgi:hypothetical protein
MQAAHEKWHEGSVSTLHRSRRKVWVTNGRTLAESVRARCTECRLNCCNSGFGSKLVFRPSTGWSTPMSLMGVVIVKVGHAIARVLKGIEIGATFGAGVTTLFVALLPAIRSRAPTVLCQGSCDCWVMATQASQRASKPSPWLQPSRGCQLLPLLQWKATGESKT